MGRVKSGQNPDFVKPYRYNKLRGRIVEKYRTQTAFADTLGMTKNAFNRKIMGKSSFSQSDIEAMCGLLDIERNEIGEFFFA